MNFTDENGASQKLPLEAYLAKTQDGDGRVDADVCWGSRHVPTPTNIFAAPVEFGAFFDAASAERPHLHSEETTTSAPIGYPPSRGTEQWEDLDWAGYYLDSGRL